MRTSETWIKYDKGFKSEFDMPWDGDVCHIQCIQQAVGGMFECVLLGNRWGYMGIQSYSSILDYNFLVFELFGILVFGPVIVRKDFIDQ